MGILTLPYGVKMVGPFLGFVVILFIGILVALSTHLLLEVADDSKFKGSNYEILGRLLWGRMG